ncbi:MAG: oxidoreductase [Gracilibacter sp. BRH_c7a]|nr:MAG: oxidoreductase [Gracilibacter sp. BRH_c7a]
MTKKKRKETSVIVESSKSTLISRRKVIKIGAMASAALALGIFPGRVVKAAAAPNAPKNPKQMGFIYDQGKCVACRVCQAACKDANNWEEGTEWRRVYIGEKTGDFLSISCNHCDNPACATVCPVRAYTKRDKDGIVIQDREKCVGCKYCMYACPYHAPQFSDDTGRISKCHFCFERQDNGEKPACAERCPTGALSYGELSKLQQTQGVVTRIDGLPSAELTRPSWVIIPKA